MINELISNVKDMAIYIETDDPQGLLEEIRRKIEDQTIKTWTIDADGDYSHVSQWKDRAWMKSYPGERRISFGIIGRKDENMTKMVYGIYHGRFSEMLLTHFDTSIKTLELTPNGVEGIDSFK